MGKGLRLSRRAFLRLGVLGALGVAAGRGFVNSRRLALEDVSVDLARLPAAFDGFTIGQITDIHAGPLVPARLIEEGVDLVLSRRPDLIVLTGDFVSGATRILRTTYGGFRQRHLDACMTALSRLKAPFGVFAVLGNHDFWSGPAVTEQIVRRLKAIGVRVLRNERAVLETRGARVSLVGVDDYWEPTYDLMRALKQAPGEECRILLSHNPDVNQDIDLFREPVDLVVAGHTHGGQIVLPLVGAPYLPSPFGQKYRAGVIPDGNRRTYVSRGLGLFFVPIRLNCPADVSLLTLRRGVRARSTRRSASAGA